MKHPIEYLVGQIFKDPRVPRFLASQFPEEVIRMAVGIKEEFHKGEPLEDWEELLLQHLREGGNAPD